MVTKQVSSDQLTRYARLQDVRYGWTPVSRACREQSKNAASGMGHPDKREFLHAFDDVASMTYTFIQNDVTRLDKSWRFDSMRSRVEFSREAKLRVDCVGYSSSGFMDFRIKHVMESR
jgi:hypothetical protein